MRILLSAAALAAMIALTDGNQARASAAVNLAPSLQATEASPAPVVKAYWVWHGRRWGHRRWAPRAYVGGVWVTGHWAYY